MGKDIVAVKIVYDRLPEFSATMNRQMGRIVKTTMLRIERGYKQRMEGPKHGRVYRRGAIEKKFKLSGGRWKAYKGARARVVGGQVMVTVGYKFHRASAPGEAPAIDLGHLRGSVGGEMTGDRSAIVYGSAVYAARLELGGTVRGATIQARPALIPAAEEARQDYVRDTEQMLKDLR